MKDISFKRIGLLFKRYFRENWKKDVIVVSIIFGVEMLFSLDCENSSISFALLCVFYLIYSGRIYGMLGNPQRSINYLLIPASAGEKTIVNICLSQFYYPLLLVAAACLGILASTITCAFLFDCGLTLKHIAFLPGGASMDGELALIIIIMFMMFNSALMFGSVYFRRKAIIKTLLCESAFFIVVMIFTGIVFKLEMAGGSSLITNALIVDNFGYILSAFMSAVMIFFWILTFIRLRETEA